MGLEEEEEVVFVGLELAEGLKSFVFLRVFFIFGGVRFFYLVFGWFISLGLIIFYFGLENRVLYRFVGFKVFWFFFLVELKIIFSCGGGSK